MLLLLGAALLGAARVVAAGATASEKLANGAKAYGAVKRIEARAQRGELPDPRLIRWSYEGYSTPEALAEINRQIGSNPNAMRDAAHARDEGFFQSLFARQNEE